MKLLLESLSRRRHATIVAAASLALVGALVVAFVVLDSGEAKGGADDQRALGIAIASATDTPSATPSPTPTPTRTPGPVPAPRVAQGPESKLVNPSSIGFPAAPAAKRISAPNKGGLARIVSPALGLDHYIEQMGIVGGQMQSPDDDGIYAVGWYAPDAATPLGTPGHEGNAVFSAHETWQHIQGPFYLLHKARVGDAIFLDMADGTRREYQVIKITRYPADGMPMQEVLWPSDRPADQEWITLYTCGGRIVYDGSGYGDYLERDVVVAAWVG